MKEFEKELQLAKKIALATGKIQLDHLGDVHKIEYKGEIDIVTEVDKKCENFIVSSIKEAFPDDDIMAEEGSGDRTSSKRRWIIDPLDGTVNYSRGFPFFAVSIALEENAEIKVGTIYDPSREELFHAVEKQGAFLNNNRIKVSDTNHIKKALLATGFAYNVQDKNVPDNLDNFAKFIKRARAVRRPGSACLDLTYVACGRLDGFWELFLKPWDIAAGKLLVEEAGGKTSDFSGKKLNIYGTEILASNDVLHKQMQEVLIDGK